MTLAAVASAECLADLPGLLDHCPVDGYEAAFVSWGFYSPRPWRNYWHCHSYYEMCLAYAGAGRFGCGDSDHAVRAGDVFLARPGVVHEIESTDDQPLGIAFWGFTLHPPQATTNQSGPGWCSGLKHGRVVSDWIANLPAIVTALSDEARCPRSGCGGLCAALGAALVIETGRAFATDDELIVPPPQRDRESRVVAAMHRHLADNLSRPVSVRDIAAAVHLSERHAERVYAEQTGETLMAALRRLRLDLAGELLLNTTKPSQEIARACGYSDITAFRSAFRRQHGQPPQKFRSHGGTLHYPTTEGRQRSGFSS